MSCFVLPFSVWFVLLGALDRLRHLFVTSPVPCILHFILPLHLTNSSNNAARMCLKLHCLVL